MVRPTSIESFNAMKTAGVMSEKQTLAWETLDHWGPMTAKELEVQAGSSGLWKRLSELKSRGLVKEFEVRMCRVTKYKAIAWQASHGGPVTPPRSTPKPEVCPTCRRKLL